LVFVASNTTAVACAAGGTRIGRFLVLQHEPKPGTARRAALLERMGVNSCIELQAEGDMSTVFI
jgi:hypothetical protein